MELTTFNGLPIHPLLVHFVVVLVPISALILVLSLCWPAARRRIGVVSPVVAFVTLVLVPLTAEAGEWLEGRTPSDPLVEIHAELGEELLVWSLGVFLVSLAWWAIDQPRVQQWWTRRTGSAQVQAPRVLAVGLTVLGIALAVGSVVQVYRIGDSGAAAVWNSSGDTEATPGR